MTAISSVSHNPDYLNPKGVVITWATDVLADSRIEYGLTAAYGSTTPVTQTSPRVTIHNAEVHGLVPGTTYHYLPHSVDGLGNASAYSTDATFVTPAAIDRVIWTPGDSITYGQGLVHGTDDWPAQIVAMLTRPGRTQNIAVGGSSTVDWLTYIYFIQNFYNSGTLENIVVIAPGHNDGDSSTTYDNLVSLHALVKSFGPYKTAACTILAGNDYPITNGLLRANHSFADYFIDWAADSRLANGSNTTYFQDGVHPTVAGQTVMAQIAEAVLDAVAPVVHGGGGGVGHRRSKMYYPAYRNRFQ